MPDDHEALIRDWEDNAVAQDEANFRFLRSLKLVSNPSQVDALAREVHQDVFARIDCTRCARCCKTMEPGFTREDVARIAEHLGMTLEEFLAAYLEPDGEGGHQTREKPCPFLGSDDRCTIYEIRPASCREFPHTDKEDFNRRTHLLANNAQSCPAAYHILREMRRRRRRRT